jgi:hypothetical protein
MGVVFLLAAWAFRSDELEALLGGLRRRLARRTTGPIDPPNG